MPMRFRDHNWKLLFNSSSDGTSLITFYSKLYDSGPTIILIEDKAGHVFGGYASEDWKVQPRYFGTGESFVFAVKPKFTVYNWTSANDYFIQANHHYIAMGGGTNGGYAFYLDSELHWGTSETSNTFLNRQLSSTKEFYCTVVEVWGFSI
uniref:Oxidation resistance protein 1 n=1 Tax=Arcella intermedia TaxID=1963864 RepID=A0A6B2LLB7_9EUKA